MREGMHMLSLRDMTQSDIADYVRWFCVDTEWMNWDTPWEAFETTREQEQRNWTACYRELSARTDDYVRCKFEMEADGVHIGWVSAYTDTEFWDNQNRSLAIGVVIPEARYRGRGNGTGALTLLMEYYREKGCQSFLIETWSGNRAMVAVAKKLGFHEILRVRAARRVRNHTYDALTFRLDAPGNV